MSCPTTSAIRQAVISQATFQLFGCDQKPRAVAQKRRTSGLACSRSTLFFLFFFLAMKSLLTRGLNQARGYQRGKVPKVQLSTQGRSSSQRAWILAAPTSF